MEKKMCRLKIIKYTYSMNTRSHTIEITTHANFYDRIHSYMLCKMVLLSILPRVCQGLRLHGFVYESACS